MLYVTIFEKHIQTCHDINHNQVHATRKFICWNPVFMSTWEHFHLGPQTQNTDTKHKNTHTHTHARTHARTQNVGPIIIIFL